MKMLYVVLLLFICNISAYAQSNVFVLVDVSKSLDQTELNNAKEALIQVLTAAKVTKAFVSQGSQADLVHFKIASGDKLSVSKFGSLKTTLAINPNPYQIQDVNDDVQKIINSIVWSPTDGQTYITLAKAKISEYAKNNNITKYKLYIISDNVTDDYGKNGKPDYPDDYTRNLAEGYNTSKNPVSEEGYTKLKFYANSLFTLSFSPNVDVSDYVPPVPNQPVTITQDINDPEYNRVVITIVSPPEAKKGKEYEVKSETVNINWNCQNCPQGIKYTVTVSQYDGKKFREIKKDVLSNSSMFKLHNGKFKISVSASNYPDAFSDSTYVVVNTGGYGLIILLVLIVICIGIYVFWSRSRSSKNVLPRGGKADEYHSRESEDKNKNISSNTEYF